VSVIFTYVLVSRIASRQVALAASVAVAAWPSGFLWASQIMKDLPCVFLLLLTLLLLFELTDTREPTVRWPKTIALAAALFISGYLLVLLKFYLINLLLLAVAASVVVRIASKRRGLRVTDAVAVVVILLTALIGRGAGQNSVLLYLNPKSSDAIPAYLAGMELERQDVVASRQFYELAIKRQPQFWPAYRKLGVLLMRTGEIRAAIDVLQRYVTLYPFDYAAPAIRRVLLEAKALMDSGVGPTDPRFAKVQQSMLDALDPSYGGDAEFLATALKHERPGKRRALMSGRQLVTDLSTE
jgi:tetratricopeptide (TPR) repeat protein